MRVAGLVPNGCMRPRKKDRKQPVKFASGSREAADSDREALKLN